VGGGFHNTASGAGSTVPGGSGNLADGVNSFAAGTLAHAHHLGSFVWADNIYADLNSTANNQFLVRATGGISLATSSGLTTGCSLPAGGGSWNCTSDRNIKANFTNVDARAILERVEALPIQTWNYQTQAAAIRHIGPMAQDFYAAFGVGENETTISQVDADGVALAAIQGLSQQNQELKAQIEALQNQTTPPTTFNWFNLLSVIAFGGFVFNWIQQRRSKRGES